MATPQSKTKENVQFLLGKFKKQKEEGEKNKNINEEKLQEKPVEPIEAEKKITETPELPNKTKPANNKIRHARTHGNYGKGIKVISLRISQEMSEKLKKISDEEELSANYILNKALKNYIKKWEAMNEITEE